MQNITQSWFVQGMIKATTDAWLKGWDERNGGNLTLRLDDADIALYHDNFHPQPRYIPLSQPMPLLANTPFIVTGSGKFFRNVQLDPAANLGVVKVDSDGAGYHILWGLTNEAVPTSELPAHFLSHCERIKATNGKDRVIMHCHATNLICDVDFETGLISIRHSVAYAKGMGSFIKDTKTHDARGIPIDPVGLLPFLKETHEIDCGKLRLRGLTGAVEIGDCYILSEPGATFATTSYIRRAFKTFSETNGLMGTNDELITFHGLRHTFATQWIRQGGDIKALQSILGYKDAMATLNVYADIEPISKIHNMLRATPCLWRGHLGPRVDPGPMFQQRIQESIETLQAFGYGITEPDDRNIAIRDVKTNSWL